MTKIYFSSSRVIPPADQANLGDLHMWMPDDGSHVYGVAIVHMGDPNVIADRLTALGVQVLPGVNDPNTAIDPEVYSRLEKHGVKKGDRTRDIAQKMHAASGMPVLKPHFH
jgi:hypothetical protein